MKKIKKVNGLIIAQDKDGTYSVFLEDEWTMGQGFRYAEFDGISNLDEAVEQAKFYGVD